MKTDDLLDFLESVVGGKVISYLPEELDNVVMARFTGGTRDEELLTLHDRSFQVFIRDRDDEKAEQLALDVERELHGANVQIGSFMCSIFSKHDPIPLGTDAKQRYMYSMNFELQYQ
ncbi:minor capsid protein [Tumebacillus permanentifrigoris]|uniref:Minor capsid protein n=1 Tax=Tumebacillus permanentifrigoris TaxID=378543 RepID=A0A316D2Y2_9BACL|nr:minor capsid protein [Tumebacillus permanentifrigoris]PWK05303.1 hypothetical protein C7459_12452 [Tumebacillus permanentifrigoris]